MLLSIITICYNNIQGLKKTVKSILSQKGFKNLEYIIIDGGSTDGTQDYLKMLPESVRWISEKDRGISDAFNKGLKMASGDFILMLNSGDSFIDDTVVERVVKDWNELNVEILSYCVRVNNKIIIPSQKVPEEIWQLCEEPHQGTFVSKRVYEDIGGYSEEFKLRMDYHFFARCKERGYKFAFIPQVIVNYEPGGVSMRIENRKKFWKEGMAVKYKYNIHMSLRDYFKIVLSAFNLW